MDDIFTEARRRFLAAIHERVSGRSSGDRVAPTTVLLEDDDADTDSYTRHLRTVWRYVAAQADQQNRPVFIYGAGAHSEWLLSVANDIPIPQIAGFLDDRAQLGDDPLVDAPRGLKPVARSCGKITDDAGHEHTICGYPIFHPRDALVGDDAIIFLSSDSHEQVLFERARAHFGDRVTIVRLYEGLPAGPYPRPPSADDLARRQEAVRQARKRWGGSDFVGPYEQAGLVTGFLHEQWLWSRRDLLTGRVLDMSTPRHWHDWIYELDSVSRVSISDLERDEVVKGGYASKVDFKGDFCADPPPASPNTFDTVLCFSILEHCREPVRLVRNLHAILQPGGHLLLNVPFAYLDGHCRPDYWRFGRDGLELLARQAGFAEIQTGSLGDIGFLLTDVLGFNATADAQHHGLPLLTWLIARKKV